MLSEPSRARAATVFECLGVLLAPAAAFFALRLRPMAPVQLPDPSIHTVYVVDPRQMFDRYAAAFVSTARMREGAQAGFLVVARLFYMALGALPGFFATRYLFALIATVPAYVLLRRLYGRWAGLVAIVVIMSSPVVLTAWGTDYPDCAVVSYVAGAVACMAMPTTQKARPAWLAAAAALLTLATWSHGMGAVLAVVTVACYGLVRLARERAHLVRECLLIAVVAVGATIVLMFASRSVLGQFDFIRPTLQGEAFLDHPDQIRQWHSANWRWVTHVAYLLVPPAIVLAFVASFAGRLRRIPTPQLYIGVVCLVELLAFSYLQFCYHVQALEMHFFSSTMWGPLCIGLAVVMAEACSVLSQSRLASLLPTALLVGVALVYEADARVPAFGWMPTGYLLAAVPVLTVCLMRVANSVHPRRLAPRIALGLCACLSVVALSGSLLVLTVAARPKLFPLGGLAAAGIPAPAYAGALGGSGTSLVDWYAVCAQLPGFVGDPAYHDEQLLMWFPANQQLLEPVGVFHEGYDALGSGFPLLTATDVNRLAHRRPAELLLLSLTGTNFRAALGALGRYSPVLVRSTVLRHGSAVLHATLLVLRSYAAPAAWGTVNG